MSVPITTKMDRSRTSREATKQHHLHNTLIVKTSPANDEENRLSGWRKEYGFDHLPVLPSKTEIAKMLQAIRECHSFKSALQGHTDYHDEERYRIVRRREANGERGSWTVQLKRRKVLYRRDFGDSTYGGRDAALAAAKQYRDEVFAKVKPISRRERQTVLMTRNTSGVAG